MYCSKQAVVKRFMFLLVVKLVPNEKDGHGLLYLVLRLVC